MGWTAFSVSCPSGRFHRLYGPAPPSAWATTGPLASESVPTEETGKSLTREKPRRKPRLLDCNLKRLRSGQPASNLLRHAARNVAGLHTWGALAPRNRSTNQKAQIVTNERRNIAPHARKVAELVSMTSSRMLIACSHCSRLTERSRPVCHVVSGNQTKSVRFKNLRRPDRKSPGFHGRKPSQPPRISHHGCNRTRSGNRTRRGGHLVEFASMRLRL
jgi:hypothetical protein